ncbi:hypothetical protein ACWEJ6_49145 [Nonomuraea sp. NPDC004702]
MDHSRQTVPRGFDIEHTHRFWKQTRDWTGPDLRAAQDADRWTWLLIIIHTQPAA